MIGAVIGVLAVGAALAAPGHFSRPADPLEGVKTSIRLKKFAEAATALQKLAGTGNTIYFYGENGRESAPTTPLDTAGIISAHEAAVDALIGQIERPGSGHACDIRFGVRVVEILAAAEESIVTGRRVDVLR